jgi:hypothetical protein
MAGAVAPHWHLTKITSQKREEGSIVNSAIDERPGVDKAK